MVVKRGRKYTRKGIASKYLPIIQRFIGFWEETMSEDVDNELEIDEVARLFKMWNDRNGGGTIYMNQSQLLDLKMCIQSAWIGQHPDLGT